MGRVERGVWSVERGAWRVERGAWSVECGAWSVECGVWSGVEWSVEWSGVEWSHPTKPATAPARGLVRHGQAKPYSQNNYQAGTWKDLRHLPPAHELQ